MSEKTGKLAGRVVIVTGGGRGLGLEYARLMAAEGAMIVVNDLDCAEAAAADLRAQGGQAIGIDADVADWTAAHRLIETAVATFGDLHVLVNNAGAGPTTPFLQVDEAEWDAAIRGSLKTAFCPSRAAAAYWQGKAGAGQPVRASIVNTSSGAGLQASAGRCHYGSAKAGVAAFTLILAKELQPLGIRVNAIAPAARTRRTQISPITTRAMKAPDDPDAFDSWHPANIAPLVAYLAMENCPVTGRVFQVRGGALALMAGWRTASLMTADRRWSIAELEGLIPQAIDRSGDGDAPRDEALEALKADMNRDVVAPD